LSPMSTTSGYARGMLARNGKVGRTGRPTGRG